MCGILALISGIRVLQTASQTVQEAINNLQLADFQSLLTARGPDRLGSTEVHHGNTTLVLCSSLLQLRGTTPAPTPHIDSPTGNILLFNGEVFGGLDIERGHNDGHALLTALSSIQNPEEDVPEVLSNLRGPWAAVFWHAATATLWFGRDVLGRRSLLVHFPTSVEDQMVLCSVMSSSGDVPASSFSELPPGIYSITIDNSIEEQGMHHHDWRDDDIANLVDFNRTTPFVGGPSPEEACQLALAVLQQSVTTRCSCIDTVETNGNTNTATTNNHTNGVITTNGNTNTDDIEPAKVLVLFSGGVDSTLLAALAHTVRPPHEPIDLASVCFDNGQSPDRLAAIDALEELRAFAPTREWRLTCVNKTLEEIDTVRGRLLNLLAPSETVMDYNIGSALWTAAQGEGVLHDQGKAKSHSCNNGMDNYDAISQQAVYRSKARIVLLGHGADEFFGGYSRHRTRYRAAGWEGLAEELAIDMRRLWVRNLGRDDRLIADSGREARHPFLDERVIKFALDTPLSSLVDMDLPPGHGDKRVLRDVLRYLGLPRAAERTKRAIQFGSRLAKQTNARDFGGTRQANARAAGKVKLAQFVDFTVKSAHV